MVVIILGMHRSGTSMLSSIVHSLGISMGPPRDLERNNPQSQPHGYWEDKGFTTLNEQILYSAGGRWDKPPGRLKILTASMEYRDKISELIEKHREKDDWGWKDPRNCLCIECYQYVFLPEDNVKYIHIIRDKEAIVQSLIKRGEIDQPEKWKQLTYEYERRVRDFLNRYQVSHYTVAYEDILKYSEYEVSRLAQYLGIDDEMLIKAATERIKQ